MQKKKSLCAKAFDWLKSIFFNGILIILPMAITFAILSYFFRLFKGWIAPISRFIPGCFECIPHAEIILGLALIFLVGFIFKSFFLRSFLHAIENTFFKIPLLEQLYFGIKQMIHAFTAQDTVSFKSVVIIEFPRPGVYSLGLLTSEVPKSVHSLQEKKYFYIFIPTTPNPTTGFLIMATEDQFTAVDLTRQEAMSLIISGGIIQPERFKNQQASQ